MHISVPPSLEHTAGAYHLQARWPRGFKQRWIQSQQLIYIPGTIANWPHINTLGKEAPGVSDQVSHVLNLHISRFLVMGNFSAEVPPQNVSAQRSCVPVESSSKTPGLSPLPRKQHIEIPRVRNPTQETVATSSLENFTTWLCWVVISRAAFCRTRFRCEDVVDLISNTWTQTSSTVNVH